MSGDLSPAAFLAKMLEHGWRPSSMSGYFARGSWRVPASNVRHLSRRDQVAYFIARGREQDERDSKAKAAALLRAAGPKMLAALILAEVRLDAIEDPCAATLHALDEVRDAIMEAVEGPETPAAPPAGGT